MRVNKSALKPPVSAPSAVQINEHIGYSGIIKGDQCSIVLALQTGGFDAVRVEKPVLEINNTRGKTYIKIN